VRLRSAALFVLPVVSLSLALPPSTAPAFAAGTCGRWKMVKSPKVGNNYGKLFGVSAVSASNAWTVGFFYKNGYFRTLAEHWNGTAWGVQTTPNIGTQDQEQLEAVAAISRKNVWAVGYDSAFSSASTVIVHWNGSHWKLVPSPNPGTRNYLYGIVAISATNLWAVGYSDHSTLILHGNGRTWKIVTSPNPDMQNQLYAIARVPGTTKLWAVGTGYQGGTIGDVTLIMRYSGGHWASVPSKSQGTSPTLFGVAAISSNNVWAVGRDFGSDSDREALVERWNGTHWSIVASPNINGAQLEGIVALSGRNIWMVGAYHDTTNDHDETLVLHKTRTKFTRVNSPNPTASDNYFNGIGRVPSSTSLWAVGTTEPVTASSRPLIESYCP